MKIRAMSVPAARARLAPWSYESGPLGENECLIRVRACGICHSDIHMIDDDWEMTAYPLVPGHEIVGDVEEVGASVTNVRVGDRVGVGWQRSACLDCGPCLAGDENLCAESRGVIVGSHGGYAEYVVVDARFAFRMPDGLETVAAAPLLCGGITVYSALRHAGMGSGGHIGVLGLGGLGHLAVQFASRLGNEVTIFTTSDDKADLARRLGARDAVVTKPGKAPARPARPLDILLTTVPVDLDWAHYLSFLETDGTLAFVGVPPSDLRIPVTPLIVRRLRIMGSPIGGRAAIREMLDLASRLKIAASVEAFPLADAQAAVDRVRRNEVRFRAVLTV